MPKSKFYQDSPREEVELLVQCHASPKLFGSWEELSKGAKKEFEKNGSIPCEGGGVPGIWCQQCRFGVVTDA